jgi:AraC-like DNA-binding protein
MADLSTIQCERRSYQEEPQTHDHAYAQLVIPVEGILAVTVKERVLKHDQQTVIYIPPDAPHSFYADTSNQFLVWDIPAMYVNHQETVLPLSQPLDSRWNAARDLILTEVGPEGPSSNRRLSDLFRYILGLLTVALEAKSVSLAYINEHYNQLLTIEQLAAIEHYNPSYYCQWFQKQHGLSPMAYIRQLRLEKAKDLLQETEFNILQIAEQVGYRNQSTLTRLFQEWMGMPPSEYRMQTRIPVKKLPQES